MASFRVKDFSEFNLSPDGWEPGSASKIQFATRKRDGAKVIIKCYTTIKEPVRDASTSDATFKKRTEKFERMINSRIRVNERIRSISGPGGNLIIPYEEFVCEHLYTEVSEVVPGLLKPEDILKENRDQQIVFIKTAVNALAAVHAQGVIHVDIKPPNVVATHSGSKLLVAKILDFDSSLVTDRPIPPEIGGDPAYQSPEQVYYGETEGDPEAAKLITEKTDVYSMGLTLHFYLTGGKMPSYKGVSEKMMRDRIAKKEREGKAVYCWEPLLGDGELVMDPSLDSWIAEIIARMTVCNPEDRPTCKEVFRMLNEDPSKAPLPPDRFEAPRAGDSIAWKQDQMTAAGYTGIRPASQAGKYELLKDHKAVELLTADELVKKGFAYSTTDDFEPPRPEDELEWVLEKLKSRGYTGIHADAGGKYTLTKSGRVTDKRSAEELIRLGYAKSTREVEPPPPAVGMEPPRPEDGIREWNQERFNELGFTGIVSEGGGKYALYSGAHKQCVYDAARLIRSKLAVPGRGGTVESDVFDPPMPEDGIASWNEAKLRSRGYTGIHPLGGGQYALVKNGRRNSVMDVAKLLQLSYGLK